ncbi:uncharacterized protein LOC128878561 [Hylaeus volcanicus]|uniref:uncharacterized protein LOC128878561 n=1 Tax=Hylaeus volcanicus TaxID=313075 RepID=UPI0023B8616E|nr:uncharacterized protein LOC128878561 [Hylaeus volcanicus]
MHILRYMLTYMSVCGCWRPLSWTSGPKKFLYTAYMVFLFLVIHSFLLSLILDLVLTVDNPEDFSDNFYLTAEVFVSSWKMRSLIRYRGKFAIIMNNLEEESMLPRNADEAEIRKKFDNVAQLPCTQEEYSTKCIFRKNLIAYILSLTFCATCMVATSIGSDFKTRQLTYRSWIPYDYSSLLLFTVTYIYQATSLSVCSFYNIGADSLFSSLLIHIYCQFEILGHRLKSITKEGKVSAKLCANHHNQIYQLATKVNEEYKMIILIQFLTSTSILCIELYQLTQREVDSKYIVSVVYTSCALMQLLYYCWYGNEVQLKSLEVSDMVMECNLESLDNNSKKILLMIMKRAMDPVEFTSLYIVNVNLASFMALLKLSYSAFNLLKQDKEYLVVTQILDIMFNVNSQQDFSDNFYMTAGVFITCFKLCNLLTSRENYAILIGSLQKEPFTPKNDDEIEIQTRFDKWAQWNAIVYTTMIDSCLVCLLTGSIFTGYRNRKLMYRVWLPYNYSSSILFTITYAHQAAGMSICALVNSAYDTLFSGLLIHTYCIFEILGYRLKNIIKYGDNSAKQCARLHNYIYKFATMANKEFKTVVLAQFMMSMFLLCFDLYQLTQNEMQSDFVSLVLYTFCTIMQILYYCWYGNEVKVKSLEIPEMIIESNWTSLSNDDKKILLMIMRRARVPIQFSSVKLVTVDLNSFKTIVKTSYSALNVLRNGKAD